MTYFISVSQFLITFFIIFSLPISHGQQIFWILAKKGHPFQKTHFFVMFEWRFHGFTWLKFIIYQHVAKKHLQCIHIFFTNKLGRFHLNISFCCEIFCSNPSSWNLFYCPNVGNVSNVRKYWFHAKQLQKRSFRACLKLVNGFSICFVFLRFAANQRFVI